MVVTERMMVYLSAEFGEAGHQLADLDAGGLGLDRLELAAILGGSVRLHVEHIGVRRTAAEPDADHVLRSGPRPPGGRTLCLEHVQQRDAAKRGAANPQEIATTVTQELPANVHDRLP